MRALLVSPHLIDVILILTCVEAIGLVIWLRGQPGNPSRSGSSIHDGKTSDIVAIGLMLLPGICLMLALRAALAGAAWPFVPAALAASLLAHLLDLRNRWRK